jgi:hypothetical protein
MGLRFTRGLLLPVLMAGPWAQADRRPQPAISELEVDEDGLAILRVDLHPLGAEDRPRSFRFALDTGAALCVLDLSVPETLFWDDGARMRVRDCNGATSVMPLVSLKRVAVGGLIRDGVPALRLDLKKGPTGKFQDEPVDGLLGMSFLDGTRFLLDMEQRQLHWWAPAPASGLRLPLHYGPDKSPRVSLRVGDRDVDGLVDTGRLAGLGLPWSLRPKGKGTECLSGGAASVSSAAEELDLPEVGVAGGAWRNPPVLFQAGVDIGNVGMEVFAPSRTGFDFLQHQLILIPGRDSALPLRPRSRQRLVLGWDRSGPVARLAIEHVFPDSAEQAAGFRAGDEILQVGALTGSALSRRAIRALVGQGQPLRWLLRRKGEPLDLIHPAPASPLLQTQRAAAP